MKPLATDEKLNYWPLHKFKIGDIFESIIDHTQIKIYNIIKKDDKFVSYGWAGLGVNYPKLDPYLIQGIQCIGFNKDFSPIIKTKMERVEVSIGDML
jgi:hypothetical protein